MTRPGDRPPPPKSPTPRSRDDEPLIVAAPEIFIVSYPASLKNYARTQRTAPDWIVLHATDGHEGPTKDRDVAAIFADPNLPKGRRRSAHWIVDTNSVAACVEERYTAWHCGPTGNAHGIGLELCGRAAQTRAEWFDAGSFPMLCIAARLVADRCRVWSIPPRVLNARDLRVPGARGITTHSFVSQAFGETNHHDPGVGFPLGAFVRAVAEALALAAPATPTPV